MSPWVAFTGEPSALRYVLGNAGLLITQYDIAGILADTPNGVSVNGALWTLVFEAGCYAVVAAAGVVGVLRGRRGLVAALGAVLAGLTVMQEAGLPVLVNDRVLRLLFVFVLGMLAHLYAERIPMRADLALASAAVFLLAVGLLTDYRALGAAPFAYLCLWLGTSTRVAWSPRHDLSYGIYIYHWPVLALVNLTGAAVLPTPVFVAVGLAAALVPASLSWFAVERPALAHKHTSPGHRMLSPWRRRTPARSSSR
jgi:peptidoglycan/LPS O-acetylase OafA/YrhL